MTGPGREQASAWAGYTAALGRLHAARTAVASGRQESARERARRQGQIRALDAVLAAQQEELLDLAAQLRAPDAAARLGPEQLATERLGPERLGPERLPQAAAVSWQEAETKAAARYRAAAEALTQARQVARLPQLLPQWTSQFGRAAVVYFGFTLPNLVVLVVLSGAGVHANTAATVWFAVLWPLVTAAGGALTLGWASVPRLPPEDLQAALARSRPMRRYPWLGLLMAWGNWLIIGWLLDQLAGLLR